MKLIIPNEKLRKRVMCLAALALFAMPDKKPIWQKGNSAVDLIQDMHSHVDPGTANPRAWCVRHFLEKQYQLAIEDCNEAIRADPDDGEPYSNRGSAFLALGNVDNALIDFSKAIRLNPGDPRHYYNRGLALETKGDLARAIDDYSEAIRLNPHFAAAHFNRAQLMKAMRQYDKAIIDYRNALALAPELSPIILEQLRRLGAEP